MDEETLQTSILTYKQQLQQVETVLLSAGTEGQAELLKLRDDLQQVIQLTEESLLSLKKSKLLSFVDGSSSVETNSSSVKDESPKRDGYMQQGHSSTASSSADKFDDEYAAFQAAIAAADDDDSTVLPSHSTSSLIGETTGVEAAEDDDEEREEDDISGTKCSVDHMEEWGGRQRQNAVVLCVEPRNNVKEEASLRVLFCNPTSTSMKPCPYFLEGSCRFSVEDCRFSHGYIVKLSELHSFREPDFGLLELEAPCLARYSDGVWYPASIQHIDEEQHQVTVQYESYGTTATLDVESVLPSEQSTEPSPPLSSSSEDDSDDDDDDDDVSLPSTSYSRPDEQQAEFPCVAWRPSGDGVPLGEWEAHTRGIGSKLMAKMGYEFGKGLGRYGEGRVEPVEAVIVPQGKSLDKCMELREMKKLGIVGKPKKKKGKVKGHQHNPGGSSLFNGEQRKKENVFDFINRKLGGKKTKITELIQHNMDSRTFLEKDTIKDTQEEKPNRTLNIQLVRTQEDIRSTEKQLVRLQESLRRNQRDKLTISKIQEKIDGTERILHNLKSSEKKIKRQRNSREEHRKLMVF